MGQGRLIALYGYPGSGKDEVAKYLVEKYGFVRMAFADPIREMLVALDPIIGLDWDGDLVRFADEAKVIGIDDAKRIYPEVRRLLQRLGTEAGRDILGQNIWVGLLEQKINDSDAADDIVITDVRFPNEYQMLKRQGAEMVRMLRDGCGPMGHESEQHYGEFQADFALDNNGTLGDLKEKVEELLDSMDTGIY